MPMVDIYLAFGGALRKLAFQIVNKSHQLPSFDRSFAIHQLIIQFGSEDLLSTFVPVAIVFLASLQPLIGPAAACACYCPNVGCARFAPRPSPLRDLD